MKSYKERGETQKKNNKIKKEEVLRKIKEVQIIDENDLKKQVIELSKKISRKGIVSNLLSINLNLLAQIIKRTEYLGENLSKIPERIYHIKNDLTSCQKCIVCGKNCRFNVDKYSSHCGSKCANGASWRKGRNTRNQSVISNNLIFEDIKKEIYKLGLNQDKDVNFSILKYCSNNKLIILHSLFKNVKDLEEVVKHTLFLPYDFNLLERVWYLKNNHTILITCKHPKCKNIVKSDSYKGFCSRECRLKFSNSGVSKKSQELFETLAVNLNLKEDSFYFLNNKEKRIILKDGSKISVDFLYKNKIIEYFGDMWHANPLFYKSEDFPNVYLKKTAKEIQSIDNKRIKNLEELGFECLIVWESDYINSPGMILEKCCNFLERENVNVEKTITFDRLLKEKKPKEKKIRKSYKGKTYEEIYGVQKAEEMRNCRKMLNAPSAKKRTIVFPNGESYFSCGDFEKVCKENNLSSYEFKKKNSKGEKYKGFSYIELEK